jgi:hypothetical protein
VTLSLWPLRDLGDTKVTVSDLVQGRRTIPASSVAIYPVRCLDKRVVYSSDYYLKDMPVLLEERHSVVVREGRAQSFWLDVHLPSDAEPGLYEGQVTITPTQGEATSVRLQVRVLPFVLLEPKEVFWGEYYTGPKFAPTPGERNVAVALDLADQRAHGMTSVGLCFGMDEGDFRVEGGKVTIAPKPDSRYVAFMEAYQALGFPMPVIQLSDDGQTAAAGFPFGSAEWQAAYRDFWTALAQYHKQRGWPELIVQPVDEPGWQGPAERDRNVVCLKALKEIAGQRTEQDGPGDSYFLNVAGPHADVWNFNGALAEPGVIARAQKQGNIILTYNNDVESYRPETDRYVCGFYQLRAGARGAFNWEYMGFGGDPYDDQDSPEDSWLHRYPAMPEQGEVGGFSTGWQGTRAGVDDYRYAYTLQRAVARGLASRRKPARQAAERGQRALASILATLDYHPATRETAQWGGTSVTPEGTKQVSGQLKQPNDWDFETYDQARWQIAAATMEIMAALGEIRTPTRPERKPSAAPRPLVSDVRWLSDDSGDEAAAPPVTGQVSIPVVGQGPRCDGSLDDGAWQKAAELRPFTLMNGSGAPRQQTRVLVCADLTHLYFGLECAEENVKQLTAKVAQDGGPVWEDDCVELFFDPTLQRQAFRQIGVNSLGRVAWNDPANANWRPEVLRGVRVEPEQKRWVVEVGVPIASLGLSANTFGLNVCRERRPLESLELSCWSPTGDGFGVPERFGVASIGGSYLAEYRLGRGLVGSNELQLTIRNESRQARRLLATLSWQQRGQAALYRQEGPYDLAPGQSKELGIGYDIVTDKAPVELAVTVKDADGGQVLTERRMQQAIPPALKLGLRPKLFYLSDDLGALQLDLNLAAEVRQRAAVALRVLDAGGSRVLRRTVVTELKGRQMQGVLDLRGLGAGTYLLEAVLTAGPGPTARRLATTQVRFMRLAGPFD